MKMYVNETVCLSLYRFIFLNLICRSSLTWEYKIQKN